MNDILIRRGDFEILRDSKNYPLDDLDDEGDSSMHISTINNELSEEELGFEIIDKIDLIEELIRRRESEREREIRLT